MDNKKILDRLDRTNADMLALASSFREEYFNRVPFANSWTAAEVLDHVTKSHGSILQSLRVLGSPSTRSPEERATELAEIFSDFSGKLNSPKFILPTGGVYEKERVIDGLKKSIERLQEARASVDLSEALHHPVFDEITKLELMHFVAYHTERHLHQLQNIYLALQQTQ